MTTTGLNIGKGRTAIRWIAAAALASVCAVALSACEENGPATSSEPAAAAPSQAPADLMGAPQGQASAAPGAIQETPLLPGGDTTRTPQYVPPAALAPPPGAYAPGPAPTMAPPPAYPAPAPPAPPAYASHAPTEVIAMQPIPNPPEGAAEGHWHAATHHRHHGWWGPVYAAPAAGYAAGHAARHHYTVGANPPAAPAHHAAAPAHAQTHATAQAGGAQLTKPEAPGHKAHGHKGLDQGTVAAASGGSTAPTTNETANATGNVTSTGDARYDALQTALTADAAHAAILNAPRQIQPGQTADVTLTVSSDFAQTLRTEAASQNLSDQATSANLEATLAGDGYTIVPNETQALPLTLGAPTVFHWKVTPQGAAQGPLHADLRANLLAANHVLSLGTIKTHSGMAGRVIGVGLLVLIALVLLGWVTRSRRPSPSSGAKPRPNHQTGGPAA
jgi:hypothetical protein